MHEGLIKRYTQAYFDYLGYDIEKPVQGAVDSELSLRYPLIVKRLGGRTVVCVTGEMEDALPYIETLPANSGFDEAMALLFEPDTPHERDVSYIGVHDIASFSPLTLPEGILARPLDEADKRHFRALERSLTARERSLAQVSFTDRELTGLFDGDELVSCASVIMWDEIADIGVMTRPGLRGKGFGSYAVSALCERIFAKGYAFAQYRCDESNAASAALMRRVGFVPIAHLTGAVLKL